VELSRPALKDTGVVWKQTQSHGLMTASGWDRTDLGIDTDKEVASDVV
jgi:hypothetical protein